MRLTPVIKTQRNKENKVCWCCTPHSMLLMEFSNVCEKKTPGKERSLRKLFACGKNVKDGGLKEGSGETKAGIWTVSVASLS